MRAALALLLLSCAPIPAAAPADELVCCGRDEVFILDASLRKVWSWRAAEAPGLPDALRKKFGSTDECKPVEGGAKILITSSGGAAALVERATGRALFWASVQNAHSAELLPDDRVVVAGSYGAEGNRLVLYDLDRPDRPLFVDELYSGHGVVWDAGRGLLWALGEKELRSYRLRLASLERVESFTLPDAGGHDLRPVPGSADLIVTVNESAWLFDRDRRSFRPHPSLGAHVKSADVHPLTGRTVFIRAEERFWGLRLLYLDPPGDVPVPGEKLYKVRWLVQPAAVR